MTATMSTWNQLRLFESSRFDKVVFSMKDRRSEPVPLPVSFDALHARPLHRIGLLRGMPDHQCWSCPPRLLARFR